MVPFTEAIESRVNTRSRPRRCLAAVTMMSPRWRWIDWPLHAAATNSSVRSFTSTVDPSASRSTARAPGPVRTDSRSPMAAPASSVPAATRYKAPSAVTTVARAPPGAIMPSMVSRPTYTSAKSSPAAAASTPRRTQRACRAVALAKAGMAVTVLSPFISAIRGTTARASTEMVFHQEAAVGAQVVA